MKKYLYLIKNSKIPTYLKYWLMYSSKKISLLIQSLPITLENTIKDLKIVINKIYGNTKQDTTTGKNLLPPFNSGSLNGLTFTTNSNGITTISGTTTSITTYFKNVNKILPAGTYTLSINLSYTPPANSSQLILQDINNVRLATINLWKITSKTFTLSADTEIKNYYIFSNSGIQHNGTISIQLEEGSTATPYEPYTGGQASPNPDYPQEITNVTGDVEVKVQNKNKLLLRTLTEQTSNGITFTPVFDEDNNLKYINVNGTATASANIQLSGSITLNGTFTLSSGLGISTTTYIRCLDSSTYAGVLRTDIAGSQTATLTNRTVLTYLYVENGTTVNNVKIYPMIEIGSTATNYVPLQRQTLPLTLGNIELCKIGDYQDYFYKNNGKWYKYNAINKLVLNGSENWVTGSFGTNSYLLRIIAMKYPLNANDTGLFIKSSHFRGIPITSRLTSGDNLIYVEPSPFINIRNTPFTSISDFKTWLSTHNTIVYYILATPTSTEITDTALISQLEAINNAKSYEGQTNISSNQNIYLDIDYIKRG